MIKDVFKRLTIGVFVGLLLLSVGSCQETRGMEIYNESIVLNVIQESKPDFKAIEGEGVSLCLPPEYEGGNPQTELRLILEELKNRSEAYQNLGLALENNKESVLLLAFDGTDSGNFITNVNITSQRISPGITLDELMRTIERMLSRIGYKVVENKRIKVGDETIGQIIVNMKGEGIGITQLIYTILKRKSFQLVTYSTATEEFERRFPDFEKSILTLKWN